MRLKNLTLQTNHQVFKPMSGFVADSNEFVPLIIHNNSLLACDFENETILKKKGEQFYAQQI